MPMPSARKLRWYYARLRSMSAAEIGFRARRAGAGLLARWRQRGPRSYEDYLPAVSAANAFEGLRGRMGVPERETARGLLVPSCPDAVSATVTAAREICEGRLCFFARTWQYGPDWQWLRDPRGDKQWPLRHWSRVDIRGGGAKYVWEPNRHQHLICLAKARYWTGDGAFSRELERQLRSWLDQNPPYYGIHWTGGIELAVRLVSWCWALAFAGDAPELTESTRRRLLAAIALQAGHIRSRLSAHSSANNHLIAEASALALVGMLFSDLPPAAGWLRTGLSILSRELERQVHPDGVGAEQAIHYHGEVLEWYLLVAALERRRGGVAHHAWRDRLLRMATFLERIGDRCDNLPAYGDSDDAQVAPLADTATDYYRSLRVVTAVLYGERGVLRGGEPPDERAFWLCGAPGVQGTDVRVEGNRSGRAVFPQGGWVIHRTGGRGLDRQDGHLVLNCGALGYGSIAAHGHADALSLWLSIKGIPLLIDPGTGTYHEDDRVRAYFRSTRAHNTVVVDDLDQSLQTGPTIWRAHARTSLRSGSLHSGVIAEGRHLGYRRLRDPVTHRRTVTWCEPGAYAVLDEILGEAAHRVSLYWHTPPGTRVAIEQDRSCLIEREDARTRVWWRAGVPMRAEVFEGCKEPLLGWYSPAYGAWTPAPSLQLACRATLPLTIVTIIDLDLGDPVADVAVAAADGAAISVRLERRSGMLEYVFPARGTGEESATGRGGYRVGSYRRRPRLTGFHRHHRFGKT